MISGHFLCYQEKRIVEKEVERNASVTVSKLLNLITTFSFFFFKSQVNLLNFLLCVSNFELFVEL